MQIYTKMFYGYEEEDMRAFIKAHHKKFLKIFFDQT